MLNWPVGTPGVLSTHIQPPRNNIVQILERKNGEWERRISQSSQLRNCSIQAPINMAHMAQVENQLPGVKIQPSVATAIADGFQKNGITIGIK